MRSFRKGCLVGLFTSAILLGLAYFFPIVNAYMLILWPASILGALLTSPGPLTFDRAVVYMIMFIGNAVTYGVIWLIRDGRKATHNR